MDCLVVAGGTPRPDDPLYTYTQGNPKALISIGGRTMLERVVDALQGATSVDEILVVGIGADRDLSFTRPVHFLPDQGSLVTNGLTGIAWLRERNPRARQFLLSPADIPALTSEIVDAFISLCQPFDSTIYYSLVLKETIEARFPNSRRTFVPLKGVQVSGGNIFIASPEVTNADPELLSALANGRKAAWKLARVVGLRTLVKFLLRRLAIGDISELASRIAGYPVEIVVSPYAEMAMDVDKPQQVELLAAEVSRKSV
jgi:GTP:adenosylcobinamide-phosphate guanylyltransferase